MSDIDSVSFFCDTMSCLYSSLLGLGQFPTTTPSTVKVVQGDGAQIACPQINFTPGNVLFYVGRACDVRSDLDELRTSNL